MTRHSTPRRRFVAALMTAAAGLAQAQQASAPEGSTSAPEPAASAAPAPAAGPRVRLATTEGDIVLALDDKAAPKTVANFVAYVRAGHYDGTVFHRVIDGFMVQGGGYTPELHAKPTRAPIPLESRNGLSNVRGTIAMARTAVPDSATSQWFINVVDNVRLDATQSRDGHGYAVFGRVVEGMDVVDRIRAVPTQARGEHANWPRTPIVVTKATVLR